MKGMAAATGGSYLEVTKEHSVEQMFEHIAEDLHNQYSLGFTSDRPATKVEVRQLGLTTDGWGPSCAGAEMVYRSAMTFSRS